VEVAFVGALQNAVGNGGASEVRGVKFGGYGGNQNRVVKTPLPRRSGEGDSPRFSSADSRKTGTVPGGFTTIAMDKSPDPMVTGPVKVRDADGREVRGPEMYWIAGLPDLTPAAAEVIVRIAADGGVLLIDGVGKNFFDTVAALRTKHRDFAAVAEVFEDFEKKTYEGWTISGTAFGKGPSHGTQPNQQPVSGFAGRGLVNTYIGSDEPQGTATSKPFTIKRRYIGFLIGGGNHPNQTCINLRVGGKVVRSTTGKNQERLEPASWDVAEFKGKEAAIEIVDKNSEGWGHINVDQIIFSDIPPEPLLQEGTALEAAAKLIELSFESADDVPLHARTDLSVFGSSGVWKVDHFTRLQGFSDAAAPKPISGRKITIETPDGKVHPIVIQSPLRKGKLILALAPGMPWNVGRSLIGGARTEGLKNGEELEPGNTSWGTMALASLDAEAIALPAWTTADEFAAFAADPKNPRAEASSKSGETINAALAAPLSLKPGESKSVTFAITWHFPNVQRFQHSGNFYSRRFRDATAVVDYLAKNLTALWDRTRQYHDTIYQSNIPEEFLDAMSSQSVILRGPTCWQSEEGYFGGFEGSYGCCPLNCTHVWNYAHTHARLFPTIGQNMRVSNFITFLHPNGETSHREHAPHNAFIDGHCACIEAALREYQLSPDRRFLEQIWPGVKKAVNWLIGAIDPNRDGMPHGLQWNTYDTAVSGQNTFIGSQYLSALAAGVRMAEVMSDGESAKQWQQVLDTGRKNQNEKLWNGEYFIQIPEPKPANDYNTGCHVDQLLWQWWAHMLGLGYLYPAKRVKTALAAVMKHNHRERFAGFKQAPRRYIPD
ncbi:MAG TPA: GH116 family glycosyl hydrolase, partial [Pirellulales bacterium]